MSTTASNVFYNNNNAAKPFRSSAAAQSTSMLPNSSLHHNVFATSSEGPVFAAPSTTPSAASLSSTNQHGFSPYDLNGGTVAAVAGPDYVVVAADTRLSSGYEILCRDSSKLFGLVHSSQCVLASSGCKTDVDQLRSLLNIKMKVRSYARKVMHR